MGSYVVTKLRAAYCETVKLGRFFFLDEEGYSTNTSPRTPIWGSAYGRGVRIAGTIDRVLRRACESAHYCEGGMLRIRGVASATPEMYTRRVWAALRNAVPTRSDSVWVDASRYGVRPLGSSVDNAAIWRSEQDAERAKIAHIVEDAGIQEDKASRWCFNLANAQHANAILSLLDREVQVNPDVSWVADAAAQRKRLTFESRPIEPDFVADEWIYFKVEGNDDVAIAINIHADESNEHAPRPIEIQWSHHSVGTWYDRNAAIYELNAPNSAAVPMRETRYCAKNPIRIPESAVFEIYREDDGWSVISQSMFREYDIERASANGHLRWVNAPSTAALSSLRKAHLARESEQSPQKIVVDENTVFYGKGGTCYKLIRRLTPGSQKWLCRIMGTDKEAWVTTRTVNQFILHYAQTAQGATQRSA